MNGIDILEKEYSDILRKTRKAERCLKEISEISRGSCETIAIKDAVSTIHDFADDYPDSVSNLESIVSVFSGYLECIESISALEHALRELPTDAKTVSSVLEAKEKVISTQDIYDQELSRYSQKTNGNAGSLQEIFEDLRVQFERIVHNSTGRLEEIKNDARMWCDESDPLIVRNVHDTDEIQRLPEQSIVARSKKHGPEGNSQLLDAIGYYGDCRAYNLEYRKNGNLLISLDRDGLRNPSIDSFILSYVFRVLDLFPTGCINIHLFDKNPNFLYMRLLNEIISEATDEKTKRLFKIHDKLSDIVSIKKVVEGDVFHKTSSRVPDMYSLYETDRSDPFNLIIFREGILDATGHISPELIETIENMTDPDNQCHRCGVRFLIVDNSRSYERVSASIQPFIEKIKNNCEIIMDYTNETFLIDGDEIDSLRMDGDVDSFVSGKACAIASAVNMKKKRFIAVNETVTEKCVEDAGAILSIPIGKAGDDIVSLPFTCNNGACIGYMVIGQTGTGKSSFFHSLVLNGCYKYSPKELQFWLLDFKNGDASSKYRESNIPHIGKLSENNKIDDAICLFDMILEEMERRTLLLRDTSNIAEYNKTARESGMEYLPRIIIVIDEAQELFRDDNASEIQSRISKISTRMRSAGMHFVMIAQNMSDGKTYMLEDSFLKHANGRVCLRVGQDVTRDAGFGEEYTARAKEISELEDGEAYIKDGMNPIKKVKITYTSPEEMKKRVFAEICEQYAQYSDMHPLIIGTKERLNISDGIPRKKDKYFEGISNLKERNGVYTTIVGEDVYRMDAMEIRFSQGNESSVMFIGSDREIASSLCSSTVLSLIRQDAKIHLINGDKQSITSEEGKYQHPFRYICQYFKDSKDNVVYHPTSDFLAYARELYELYLEREEMLQDSEDEEVDFSPVFVIINDILGIKSYVDNEVVEDHESEVSKRPVQQNDLDELLELSRNPKRNNKPFEMEIQTIINNILRYGYKYNIHAIVSVINSSDNWRGSRILPEISKLIMYNKTDCQDRLDHSYMLKAMLDNISNRYGKETMGICVSGSKYSKMRPIIYRMDKAEEMSVVDALLKGN